MKKLWKQFVRWLFNVLFLDLVVETTEDFIDATDEDVRDLRREFDEAQGDNATADDVRDLEERVDALEDEVKLLQEKLKEKQEAKP